MKPYLVVEWSDTKTDAVGWLVIFNFVRGYVGGGIRMHPSVTKEDVIRLAETMAYKYQACESVDCGGCKGGIAYPSDAEDADQVLDRYILAIMPYIEKGVSLGSDLGTNYTKILRIFDKYGCPMPMSKRMKQNINMQNNINAYNELSAQSVNGVLINDYIAGFGAACAADEAYKHLSGSDKSKAKVVIQGMGRVALATAEKMEEFGHKIVGMADSTCFITCEAGIDPRLIRTLKKQNRSLNTASLPNEYKVSDRDLWAGYPCDILIPAALSNAINLKNVNDIKAKLIVEAANIPISEEADSILKTKNKFLICDFTANLLEAWLYDVILFERVEASLEATLKEGELLCRKNAAKQMKAAIDDKVYARESAKVLFKPQIQDDINI